jgi:hypothetical protein
MPIRFACPNCRQLLGVSLRKAGTEVKCPKCEAAVIVPTADQSLAIAAMRRFEDSSVEETLGQLVVVDRPATDEQVATRGDPVSASNTDRGIYISRRVVYLQGFLLAAVAVLFFVAGWWIGSAVSSSGANQTDPAAPRAAKDP